MEILQFMTEFQILVNELMMAKLGLMTIVYRMCALFFLHISPFIRLIGNVFEIGKKTRTSLT